METAKSRMVPRPLVHAAGADLMTVQEQLGQTSIVLTADTNQPILSTSDS